MLAQAGVSLARREREFVYPVDHPLIGEVVFMRPQHMPGLIAEDRYDLAVCGLDLYYEWTSSPAALLRQLSANCQVAGRFIGEKSDIRPTSVAAFVHSSDSALAVADLPAQTQIITEYPSLTKVWMKSKGLTLCPAYSLGSTEAHVPRDYRVGVCLVESGKTIRANGLRVLDVILQTVPVLLANKRSLARETALGFIRVLCEEGLLKGTT